MGVSIGVSQNGWFVMVSNGKSCLKMDDLGVPPWHPMTLETSRLESLTEVIPSVFQKLCIISCVSKSICSPLHNTVEEGFGIGSAHPKSRCRLIFQLNLYPIKKMSWDFQGIQIFLPGHVCAWHSLAPGCLESGSGARLETTVRGDPIWQIAHLDHLQNQRKIDLYRMEFNANKYIQLQPRLHMDLSL